MTQHLRVDRPRYVVTLQDAMPSQPDGIRLRLLLKRLPRRHGFKFLRIEPVKAVATK